MHGSIETGEWTCVGVQTCRTVVTTTPGTAQLCKRVTVVCINALQNRPFIYKYFFCVFNSTVVDNIQFGE